MPNLVARIAFLVPLVLILLCAHQIKTALDLSRTRADGTLAQAHVLRYERSDRKDVTHVELDLEAMLPDGEMFVKERLALPYSIGHRVEEDSLAVLVLPGSAQEVVIASIIRTQISIAWSNAGMAFMAFLMAFVGVIAWNRFLNRPQDSARSGAPVTAPSA